MGYTTYFSGEIALDPPLNDDEIDYLIDFADVRHTSDQHGPLQIPVPDCVTGNDPNGEKPEIFCNWVATDDGNLGWSEDDKTYAHEAWLRWLLDHLLGPTARGFVDQHRSEDPRLASFTCDHIANGDVTAQGEDFGDMWRIHVQDNGITIQQAVVTYGSEPAEPAEPALALSVLDLIRAYEEWTEDLDVFAYHWEKFLTGQDRPCPQNPSGIHQVTDGSCDLCGSKNRD